MQLSVTVAEYYNKDVNWKEHIETMATSASKYLDVQNALKQVQAQMGNT